MHHPSKGPPANATLHCPRGGLSTIELLATIAAMGLLVTVVVPRVFQHQSDGSSAVCDLQTAQVETAAELWRHDTGSWPASNLSDVGSDVYYFPDGLPICPVDGTGYTIDATGRVIGHAH